MTTHQRMRTRTRVLIAAGALVVVVGAGAGIGIAASGGEDQHPDVPITGAALDQAKAAALEHTGGGRVTGTEVGDEESLYEVEVTLDDGRQVDVQLDASFHVVGGKVDREDGASGDD
jgi:Peptidase propeptide and YPEB domain